MLRIRVLTYFWTQLFGRRQINYWPTHSVLDPISVIPVTTPHMVDVTSENNPNMSCMHCLCARDLSHASAFVTLRDLKPVWVHFPYKFFFVKKRDLIGPDYDTTRKEEKGI